MNFHYDELFDCELTTTILEQKEGYYRFVDTIFYGEKGGMVSDRGTINGLEVIDLKWEGEVLWHRVEGALSNPIKMKVDGNYRVMNCQVQSALHLLDGFYRPLGLTLTAVNVMPGNQWYEVDSTELKDEHFNQVQTYMEEAILADVSVAFEYFKGEDYPNPQYQTYEQVRVVSFGDYDRQPCGTPHVNSTGQIGGFTILDYKVGSKKTRVQMSVGWTANQALQTTSGILSDLRRMLNVKDEEIIGSVRDLQVNVKNMKRELAALTQDVLTYKAKEYIHSNQTVLVNSVAVSEMRSLSQILLKQLQTTKVLLSEEGEWVHFAIVSPDNRARDMMEALQKRLKVSGGGSPKIVSGKTSQSLEKLSLIFKEIV